MPQGNAAGYSVGNCPEYVYGGSGEVFLKVYNELGAAVNNGEIYQVVFADATTAGYFPTIIAPISNTNNTAQIGVINNSPLGKATIGSAEWGFIQLGGYCESVNVTGAVTAEYYLEVLSASTSGSQDGANALTTQATNMAFGVIKASSTVTTSKTVPVYLLNRLCYVSAT